MPPPPDLADRVRRCQEILAHAWMVRTFVKHSDEAEEFPELVPLPRTVFDLCRAVEHLVNQPDQYLRVLRKKLSRFGQAIEQFAQDVPRISVHTNFQQAVISIRACHRQLRELTAGLDFRSSDRATPGTPDLDDVDPHPLDDGPPTP